MALARTSSFALTDVVNSVPARSTRRRGIRLPLAVGAFAAGWAGTSVALNLYRSRSGGHDGSSRDRTRPSWLKLVKEAPAAMRLLVAQFGPVPFKEEALGQGRSVLVVPGLLTDDLATGLLRRTLSACGFRPYGWGQGFNLGARANTLQRLGERLDEIIAEAGGPVALIGWSLGGLYVRELAKRRPRDVSHVITLGTPFSVNLRDNNAWKLYELINDHSVDNPPIPLAVKTKPSVPTIAIWSTNDGVVAPASASGSDAEADRHIQLTCPHIELVSHPEALGAILDVFRGEEKLGKPTRESGGQTAHLKP